MSQPTFRLQSRYVLLTYSQCGDLDPWLVHDTIISFPAECIIGRENHRDGGIHLHAFVDFGKRIDLRDNRRFDVDGRHPNIAPCGRTPQTMLDYAIKDGDVVAGGLNPRLDISTATSDTVWHRIANAETVDEFWSTVRELAPRALLCNHQSLRAYADWHYRPVATKYEHPPDFNSALTTCRNLTNGYVTTCLEVVSRARRICSRPPIRGGRGGARYPSLSSHARGRFLPQSNFDRWTS